MSSDKEIKALPSLSAGDDDSKLSSFYNFDTIDPSSDVAKMPFNSIIGSKIKSARVALGLTQGSFGELINVSFQQIQKYEKGLNGISASMLYLLSQKLGIDITYFFSSFVKNEKNAQKVSDKSKHLSYISNAINVSSGVPSNVSEKDLIKLVENFSKIQSQKERKRLLADVIETAQKEKDSGGATQE